MSNLTNRIFQNWKTTTLGAVIVLGALALVAIDKATLTEAGAFIGIGIGLFFMNDPKAPSSGAMS